MTCSSCLPLIPPHRPLPLLSSSSASYIHVLIRPRRSISFRSACSALRAGGGWEGAERCCLEGGGASASAGQHVHGSASNCKASPLRRTVGAVGHSCSAICPLQGVGAPGPPRTCEVRREGSDDGGARTKVDDDGMSRWRWCWRHRRGWRRRRHEGKGEISRGRRYGEGDGWRCREAEGEGS